MLTVLLLYLDLIFYARFQISYFSSALIRQIHDQYTFEKKIPPEWENQLHVLNKRTNYLKYVMGFSAFGFFI